MFVVYRMKHLLFVVFGIIVSLFIASCSLNTNTPQESAIQPEDRMDAPSSSSAVQPQQQGGQNSQPVSQQEQPDEELLPPPLPEE